MCSVCHHWDMDLQGTWTYVFSISVSQNTSQPLYSFSKLADPPVYIGKCLHHCTSQLRCCTSLGSPLPSTSPHPHIPPSLPPHTHAQTGADMRQEWVKSHKPAARKLTITILATLFSVIGIFSLAFGVVFATRYYRGSRRDAYL